MVEFQQTTSLRVLQAAGGNEIIRFVRVLNSFLRGLLTLSLSLSLSLSSHADSLLSILG